jgi:hypothetical protein
MGGGDWGVSSVILVCRWDRSQSQNTFAKIPQSKVPSTFSVAFVTPKKNFALFLSLGPRMFHSHVP